ncbi:filamentous hemagglutinin N-terminal domain-containing protein, partial [Citrobacter sp. C411]|uniref:two-partner secretion domain-containing protein n=1 Tax=Citrobacter sp. C411 TaxID=3048144 RepID=UPI0039C039ED
MNKIYRLKFDKRRRELVVVSELATGAGKTTEGRAGTSCLLAGKLALLALLTGLITGGLPAMALANPDLPTGGNIFAGQGSISSSGNQMTVNQNSQNMVANWNSFDIGQNHTVEFIQPSSSAAVLNRVTGGHESRILGSLKANGQVFLINPNGVVFGGGARVNTSGFMVATKSISDADFMNGSRTFSGGSQPGAQIINQGSLTTTKGGFIVLAADQVKNSGHITTLSGRTALVATDAVTLQLDGQGLTSVTTTGSVVNALVENRGLISATDGQVWLTARGRDMLLNSVMNNSGTVDATGLSERGGSIVLDGGDSGVVSQSGTLHADGNTTGGKITLEGENIHLASGSLTFATGKTGGGEVYVGGGWQGKDGTIRNASKVVMDKGATIDVSATSTGHGGTAVLWSDDYTNFQGDIHAKGGALSGNGGRVETSSHNNLQAFGNVGSSARYGNAGEWLLDPSDVTIVGSGTDAGITNAGGIFSPTASGAQILNTSINNQLNNGTNVKIQTSDTAGQMGNIIVNTSIRKTLGGDATLTLLADKDITISAGAGITSSLGKLSLNLHTKSIDDDASITVGTRNGLDTLILLNGGDFYAGETPASKAGETTISLLNTTVSAGYITLNGTGYDGESHGVLLDGVKMKADSDITIKGKGSYQKDYESNQSVLIKDSSLESVALDISGTGTDIATGLLRSGWTGVSINKSSAKVTKTGIVSGASIRGTALVLSGGVGVSGNILFTGTSTGTGTGTSISGDITGGMVKGI